MRYMVRGIESVENPTAMRFWVECSMPGGFESIPKASGISASEQTPANTIRGTITHFFPINQHTNSVKTRIVKNMSVRSGPLLNTPRLVQNNCHENITAAIHLSMTR